jgi:hypothetical protein
MEPLLRFPVSPARLRVACSLLSLGLAVAACAGPKAYAPATPPSETDSRTLVHQVIDLALARRFDQLCALGTPQCTNVLLSTGTDTVPSDSPTIVAVTTVPNKETSPGTWTPGGILFSLCGLDGKGAPYHSQLLVSENPSGTGLMAMEPVFWGGFTVGSPVAEPKPSDLGSVWADCPS